MLGVLPTHEALRLAKEKELDLVEVNPKGMPPVCKIMDFGKFKYEEKKKENEAKKRQIQVELKEVKLRPKTDDHDMDVKTRHVRRFLEEGNKVKVTCRFRGREITHPETAERQLIQIIESIRDIGVIEQPPRMEGKTMTILIAPKPEIRARVAAQAAQAAKKALEKPAKPGEPNGKSSASPEELDDDDDDEDDDDEDDEDDDE